MNLLPLSLINSARAFLALDSFLMSLLLCPLLCELKAGSFYITTSLGDTGIAWCRSLTFALSL